MCTYSADFRGAVGCISVSEGPQAQADLSATLGAVSARGLIEVDSGKLGVTGAAGTTGATGATSFSVGASAGITADAPDGATDGAVSVLGTLVSTVATAAGIAVTDSLEWLTYNQMQVSAIKTKRKGQAKLGGFKAASLASEVASASASVFEGAGFDEGISLAAISFLNSVSTATAAGTSVATSTGNCAGR